MNHRTTGPFRVSRRTVLLAATGLMAGCSTAVTRTESARAGIGLRSRKLFVYSFLDVHDTLFGPQMLSSLDARLSRSLASAGVETATFHFGDSEFAQSVTAVNGGIVLPVRQRVQANAGNERRAAIDFRLLALPRKMFLSGPWKHYEIQWQLEEVSSGETVWSSVTEGKHRDAQADSIGRAEMIVDGLIEELRKGGLI